jgi:phenol/toluene 2-monooxygenase (NADH) P5/A5
MAEQTWHTGTVIRIENENYNTKRFFIRVAEVNAFNFKAGQFVTLDLPIHENKNKRWRSYSIASWPDGTNVFELLIVLLEGGSGTQYLFQNVTEGSEVVFKGPLGLFTLDEQIDKDLFFICTGTGIAPFRSMLHSIIRNKVSHRIIYLIFGCRTQKDLIYFREMRELENSIDNFHYLPTLSREKWDGHTGYVHTIYEEICKKKNEGVNNIGQLNPSSFYLCGWKAMIDEARKRIVELGYDKKSIHLELYG